MSSLRGLCFWYQSVHVAKAAASCRYRIAHRIEGLQGVDVVISESLPTSVSRRARCIVLVRPLVTPKLRTTLRRLRERGIRLIADYDDLLFAGHVSGLPGSAQGRRGGARIEDYARSIFDFDEFTVSTRPLKDRLKELRPEARIEFVPNGLSANWIRRGALLAGPPPNDSSRAIRYLAGSPSHDDDFEVVAAPLAAFLRAHPEVHLELVGPVAWNADQFPAKQVRQLPSVPFDDLPGILATTWVNIAPLQASEFAACKSAIKYLEAGAFGCPTLASPCDDIARHREAGGNAFICSAAEDWYQGLQYMLDPERRHQAGMEARDYVMEHGLAQDQFTWDQVAAPVVMRP